KGLPYFAAEAQPRGFLHFWEKSAWLSCWPVSYWVSCTVLQVTTAKSMALPSFVYPNLFVAHHGIAHSSYARLSTNPRAVTPIILCYSVVFTTLYSSIIRLRAGSSISP
ncbi:unnamed protein product, partial [Laminaria digitata]